MLQQDFDSSGEMHVRLGLCLLMSAGSGPEWLRFIWGEIA